jgi:hypothetical protein
MELYWGFFVFGFCTTMIPLVYIYPHYVEVVKARRELRNAYENLNFSANAV